MQDLVMDEKMILKKVVQIYLKLKVVAFMYSLEHSKQYIL